MNSYMNHAPPLRVHTPHPPLAPRAFTPARGPKVTSFASSMLSAALACHRARATTPLRRLPSSRSSRRHPHRDTAKDWRRRPRQWSPFCLVAVLESCTPQLAMSTIGTGLSRGEEGGAWAHCAGTSAAGWAVALLPAGPSGPVRATNHSPRSPADPCTTRPPPTPHAARRASASAAAAVADATPATDRRNSSSVECPHSPDARCHATATVYDPLSES